MGSKETDKPDKESKDDSAKETPASQEQSSGSETGAVTPDWTAFQAYSPMPPHGYVASSPQPNSYMWGVQHIMPPYGTPSHPYVAMYPHGGLYAHPSMPPGSYPYSPYPMPSPNDVPEASVNTPGSMEVNGKSHEGKENLPIKRSKGSLGGLTMIMGKSNAFGKAGASANGSYPKRLCSGESGSEDSCEGSDANSENNLQIKSGPRKDSMEGVSTQNGNSVHGSQNGRPNTYDSLINQSTAIVPMSATAGPTTNLDISMVAAGARRNMRPQPWKQDDRELKRQKRKQANRESARRSRLRKQAECDDLAHRAECLKEENASLKAEVSHIRSKYEQLLAENASLRERLGETSGQEAARNGQTKYLESGVTTLSRSLII